MNEFTGEISVIRSRTADEGVGCGPGVRPTMRKTSVAVSRRKCLRTFPRRFLGIAAGGYLDADFNRLGVLFHRR
jgi:hypothetical protein